MRATAEARNRNPRLAECMVDPGLGYPGVVDSGKVLTLTSSEAVRLGISDGTAASEEEVLQMLGVRRKEIIHQKLSALDYFLQFLLNPAVSGLLILLMLGAFISNCKAQGLVFPWWPPWWLLPCILRRCTWKDWPRIGKYSFSSQVCC